MPATFVVDASVVIEFLVPGPWGEAADRFVGGLAWPTPLELFAPDLVFPEVGNALRKLTLRKALTDRTAGRLIARLPEIAIGTIASAAILEGAWALRKDMTIYDASYAGLARALGCPLVTTDRRLARACAHARVDRFLVHDPELGRILDTLEAASR